MRLSLILKRQFMTLPLPVRLSVKDLDTVSAFYQGESGFKLLSLAAIRDSATKDKPFAYEGVE